LPSITYKEPFKKENNSTFITQYSIIIFMFQQSNNLSIIFHI
jgi:hypothetical protein